MLISKNLHMKRVRFLPKQGQLKPHFHSKARQLGTQHLPFDDMQSSLLLRTENEITIKVVSFVIFAPSPVIFILNVKPGSSISILIWWIWKKK